MYQAGSKQQTYEMDPGETADDKHYKIAFKQPSISTFLLQTTSQSDSQAIMLQATLFTGCLNHAFSSSNFSSHSCFVLPFNPAHMWTRKLFWLVSTFTQCLLDVFTPSPKWNAPYFFSSARQDESLGTAQLAHSPRKSRLQSTSGRENCYTCWFLEDGATHFYKRPVEYVF